MLTPAEREDQVLGMMDQYGGGFVKQLAFLYRKADNINRSKILNTWPEYFREYSDLVDQKFGGKEQG